MKLRTALIACGLAAAASAADVSARRMVWAHYVPWNCPENLSLGVVKHYNFPTFAGKGEDPRGDEVRTALAQGIEGFFMDVVVHKDGSAAYWDLREFLKAAEGTGFQVGFCMDVKTTVDAQVKIISKMLDAFGAHPNFPTWKGRPVAMTYTFRAWTPDEWKAILDGVEKATGRRLFLIGNIGLGYKRFDRKDVEQYADVFDMAYFFGNGGLSGQDPVEIDRETADVCRARGKFFMGTAWPGYYGAWLNGRNDFYQPYCGVDRFMAGYHSARALDTPWLHLTTWNDYDETGLAPRRLSAGTAAMTRAFAREVKGERPVAEPDVVFAYHREEFPGTLVRIEALRLPSQDARGLVVGGRLRSPDGEVRAVLPPKTLSNDWAVVEWLVPSADLARWPALVPEFAMKDASDRRRKGTFPAIFFVEPWLEDTETVRMTFADVAYVRGELKVECSGGVLTADLSCSADRQLKRAILFRNSIPLGQFETATSRGRKLGGSAASKPAPQLNVLASGAGNFAVTLSNATFRAANRLFAKTGSENFSFTPERLDCRRKPGWATTAFRAEGGPDSLVEFICGKERKQMSFGEFAVVQRVKVGAFDFTLSPDLTLYDREPMKCTAVQKLRLWLMSRPPQPNDVFWVRFEAADGSAAATSPIWPFAQGLTPQGSKGLTPQATQGLTPQERSVVETDVTLERTIGGSGQPGRWEFLTPPDEMPIKDTKVLKKEVSPLIRRSSAWSRNLNGVRPLGDGVRPFPGVNLRGDRPLTEVKDAKGGTCWRLPLRAWPSGNFKISFRFRPGEASGETRPIIEKRGGQDGPSLAILGDNRLEIAYSATGPTPWKPIRHSAKGLTPLEAGRWHEIVLESDCRVFRLVLDGREDARVELPPLRVYGNLTVLLHGDWDDFVVE